MINNYAQPSERPRYRYHLKNITAEGGRRIGASLLDMFIALAAISPGLIYVYNAYMGSVGYGNEFDTGMLFGAGAYMLVVGYGLSLGVPLITKGQTLGKKITGLRIICDDGHYVTFSKLFVRDVVYGLPQFLSNIPVIGGLIELIYFAMSIVSLVFIFSDDYNQAVHDKFAQVYVVEDDMYKKYRVERNMA